jgi:hypothetical protein
MAGHPRTPCDVEGETVKRSRILWHAGLASLLTGSWSRPGPGWVEVGRRGMDKAEPREFRGTILVVFCLERISGRTVHDMACIVTGFHRVIPGWAVKSGI